MRIAVVPLLALLAAGCGAVASDRPASQPSRPARLMSPSAADAMRTQWYETVKRSGIEDAEPALSESEVTRAVATDRQRSV